MPPVFFALAAAAGFFAAARLISSMISEPASNSVQTAEQPKHAAETARDLGRLEFDDATGVYRPKIS